MAQEQARSIDSYRSANPHHVEHVILFGDVLLGFFRPVRFVHVFFADWLTSVVKVWVTMAYATCFYTTGEGFNECPQPSNIQQCEQNPVFVNLVLPVLSTLPYVINP